METQLEHLVFLFSLNSGFSFSCLRSAEKHGQTIVNYGDGGMIFNNDKPECGKPINQLYPEVSLLLHAHALTCSLFVPDAPFSWFLVHRCQAGLI